MDCRTARLLLDFARPKNELPAGDTDELRHHLDTCQECDTLARAERAADDKIGKAMRTVPVPPGLRNRILHRLTDDRSAWQRRWLVRAGVGFAAAAVIALAVLGWLNWSVNNRPEIDPVRVLAETEKSTNPEWVEEWFRNRYGIHMIAPSSFNYALLTDYDLASFQNRQVPMLLFTRPEGNKVYTARVYILHRSQFKLPDLMQSEPSHGYTVAAWPDPDNADFAYVVVYSGDDLKPFLNRAA